MSKTKTSPSGNVKIIQDEDRLLITKREFQLEVLVKAILVILVVYILFNFFEFEIVNDFLNASSFGFWMDPEPFTYSLKRFFADVILISLFLVFVLQGLIFFLNTTYIHVNAKSFSIKDRPIATQTEHTIKTKDIRRVYVDKEYVLQRTGSRYDYHLCLALKGGDDLKLLCIQRRDEDLKFMERHLKDFLGV